MVGERARAARLNTREARGGGRRAILDAAARVFTEAGFEGARVDEIARLAGVNKAMLYYHVGNKAALYEAVLLTWMDALFEELATAIVPSMSPEAKLAAVAGTFEEMAKRSPQYPQLLVREFTSGGRNLSPVIMTRLASLIKMEGRIMEEGRNAGVLRDMNPLTVHILLVAGTVMHLMARRLATRARKCGVKGIPSPPEKASRLVADLLFNGLKAKQAGARFRPERQRSAAASHENKEQ